MKCRGKVQLTLSNNCCDKLLSDILFLPFTFDLWRVCRNKNFNVMTFFLPFVLFFVAKNFSLSRHSSSASLGILLIICHDIVSVVATNFYCHFPCSLSRQTFLCRDILLVLPWEFFSLFVMTLFQLSQQTSTAIFLVLCRDILSTFLCLNCVETKLVNAAIMFLLLP